MKSIVRMHTSLAGTERWGVSFWNSIEVYIMRDSSLPKARGGRHRQWDHTSTAEYRGGAM